MNFGLAASAQAISTRRRSPPDSAWPRLSRRWEIWRLFHQLFGAVFALFAGEIGTDLNTAIRLSYTLRRRKIDASCGR